MSTLFPTALILAVVTISPLSAGAQTPPAVAAKPAARAVAIKIANFAFAPGVVTVPAGTTVTWTNSDDDGHTVVADDKSFRSGPLDTGQTYSFTFVTPGTYAYHCGLHPQMTGRVVVTKG